MLLGISSLSLEIQLLSKTYKYIRSERLSDLGDRGSVAEIAPATL
jgi:hypothetical protein